MFDKSQLSISLLLTQLTEFRCIDRNKDFLCLSVLLGIILKIIKSCHMFLVLFVKKNTC